MADLSLDVGTLRAAIKGLPSNTFIHFECVTKPPEVTSVFLRGVKLNLLPGSVKKRGRWHNRQSKTTAKGRKVVGSLVIEIEVSDASWGNDDHEALMKLVNKARAKAKR